MTVALRTTETSPGASRERSRITLREGLAVERESYFDPAPLLSAVARTPRAWPRFLRLQAGRLAGRRSRRGRRGGR